MKRLLFAALITASFSVGACDLGWDYADSSWLEGFRFYQDGVETGTAAPELRTVSCETAGLIAGPGAVTATAYRGTDESPQSAPAAFSLLAPGLIITFSTP